MEGGAQTLQDGPSDDDGDVSTASSDMDCPIDEESIIEYTEDGT